jgi:hypothetical protein
MTMSTGPGQGACVLNAGGAPGGWADANAAYGMYGILPRRYS